MLNAFISSSGKMCQSFERNLEENPAPPPINHGTQPKLASFLFEKTEFSTEQPAKNAKSHQKSSDSSNNMRFIQQKFISKATCALSNKMATSIAMMVPHNLKYHGRSNDGKLANRALPQPSSYPAITKVAWLYYQPT